MLLQVDDVIWKVNIGGFNITVSPQTHQIETLAEVSHYTVCTKTEMVYETQLSHLPLAV